MKKPSLKRSDFSSTQGVRKRRRVKFASVTSSLKLNCKEDVPSVPTAKSTVATSDAKTIEYKSFKKLLEETCITNQSHQICDYDQDMQQCNDKKLIAANAESTVKWSYDPTTPLLPMVKVKLGTRRINSSNKDSHKCGLDEVNGKDRGYNVSILPIQHVTPQSERPTLSTYIASCTSGQKNKCQGIFWDKRKNLLQLGAAAFSLQVNEFISNRSELIHELLQRVRSGRNSGQTQNNELQELLVERSNGRLQLLIEQKRQTSGVSYGSCKEEDPNLSVLESRDLILGPWTATCQHGSPLPSDIFRKPHTDLVGFTSKNCLNICRRDEDLNIPTEDRVDGFQFVEFCDPEAVFTDQHRTSKQNLDFGNLPVPSLGRASASAVYRKSYLQLREFESYDTDLLTRSYCLGHETWSGYNFTNKTLSPCSNVSSSNSLDLQSLNIFQPAMRKSSLPLLGWTDDHWTDEQSCRDSAIMNTVSTELDHLPLALQSSPGLPFQMKGFIPSDGFESRYEAGSQFSIYHSLSDWPTETQKY